MTCRCHELIVDVFVRQVASDGQCRARELAWMVRKVERALAEEEDPGEAGLRKNQALPAGQPVPLVVV